MTSGRSCSRERPMQGRNECDWCWNRALATGGIRKLALAHDHQRKLAAGEYAAAPPPLRWSELRVG
jgi:hypothetical protein